MIARYQGLLSVTFICSWHALQDAQQWHNFSSILCIWYLDGITGINSTEMSNQKNHDAFSTVLAEKHLVWLTRGPHNKHYFTCHLYKLINELKERKMDAARNWTLLSCMLDECLTTRSLAQPPLGPPIHVFVTIHMLDICWSRLC